jgi:predicted metal-dependent phosphoesterase TrpH
MELTSYAFPRLSRWRLRAKRERLCDYTSKGEVAKQYSERRSQRQDWVDLHIHSTASDGTCTPSEIVHLAIERGLSTIAITDHDTLVGIEEAQQAASGTPLEVIPGVEINAEGAWGDLHFLGYFVHPEHEKLRGQLQANRDARRERARNMVRSLTDLGMPLAWGEVRALTDGGTIGRPHIAQALLSRDYVATFAEAFERFIGRDGPAYLPHLRLEPQEAIQTIVEAGGVSVLAHPAHSGPAVVDAVPDLVRLGLRGIEVYHPDHSPQDVKGLLEISHAYGLIATGGSDYHGPGVDRGGALGSPSASPGCVEQLRGAAAFATERGPA